MAHNQKESDKFYTRLSLLMALILLSGLVVVLFQKVMPFEIQSLLGPDHPVRIQYEIDRASFDDEATASLVVHRETPFSPSDIERISDHIKESLEIGDAFTSIVGPHNAKFMVHDRLGLKLEKFIDNGQWTPSALNRLKTELWNNSLISNDLKSFLFTFKFSPKLSRKDEKPAIDRLNARLEEIKKEDPGIQLGLLGAKIASAHFLKEMQFQQTVITPLLILIIVAFFYFIFRSWQIVVWSVFVMFVSYVITLCLIVFVEKGLGPYSSFALMVSFIVTTNDLIQFFGRFQQLEGTVDERLNEAKRIAWFPCLLTSLTTAIGFFGLIVNQNLPIRYFGLYCAFSCVVEWLLIFTILPHLMRAFNFNPRRFKITSKDMSHRFSQFIERHCGAIAYSSLAILAFAAALSFNIHVDDNFYTKFVKEHPMSQSIDLFAKSFNFVGNIDVVVKPKSQGPFDSKTLEQVTKLEHEIAEHPVVTRIASARQIQDEIKGEISDEYPGVEGDAVRSAITRVLVNYGAIKTAHNDVTNELRSVIYLKSLSTDDLDRVLKHIDIVKAKYEKELEIRPSGFSVIRSYINGRVISDFAESFFMTFVLIFLCYFWLFKNWRWALLALVPNAIPLLTISGLMSLFQVDVDTNLVILICVAFGIVGDNTIHLSYVVRSEQEKGASYNEALARAMNLIGPALLATSGVFLVCLPVFLLGNLRLFDHVAIFLSISFVMAFLADLFMFPAIQTKWGWSFNPPLPTNEPRPSNYSDMSLPILVDDHSTQKYQGPSHKVPARDSEIQL